MFETLELENSAAWRELSARILRAQVPHALLVSANSLDALRSFADLAAASILCTQRHPDSAVACGECTSCTLRKAGTHADLLDVHPLEESRAIKIDQIRAMCSELALTSNHLGARVAIIHPSAR